MTSPTAQPYPTRAVRLIVPFPPGASNDIVARVVATQLSDRLGKQVIVDNCAGGAGGIVGTEVAANGNRQMGGGDPTARHQAAIDAPGRTP